MRKTLLCALIALTMISCASLYPRFSQEVRTGDFRKYTDAGFVVTPSTSGYTYDPIAQIQMTFYPGTKEGYKKEIQQKAIRQNVTDALYQKPTTNSSSGRGDWFDPDFDYMLGEMVAEAQSMGATGILNFDLTWYSGGKNERGRYIATGFAVKIK